MMGWFEMAKSIYGEPVTLPVEREERPLRDLQIGSEVWMPPWAMDVDSNGHCYVCRIATDYVGEMKKTHRMKVTKVDNGVECEIFGDEEYSREPLYAGIDYYPVVKLRFRGE